MPKQPKHLIVCPKCNGGGRLQMPEHLSETLAALKKFGPTFAQDIRDRVDLSAKVNVFNNRLEQLRMLGLATRNRRGRFFIYKAA